MTIDIPLSTPRLVGEGIFIAAMLLIAFAWALPGAADGLPYGHWIAAAWGLWRCRRLARQARLRLAWIRPQAARPIPDGAHPRGLVLGDGFVWVGCHAHALQRYAHRYQSLPQDPGRRGGSPAIHGCGSARDQAVILPYARLSSHVAMEGATQSGKTALLALMARQLIAANQGAVVVIDPKGSDALHQAAYEAARREGRRFALIRPRAPRESQRFNVISSCQEPTDLPGRLRPLFPEGREAYFKEEPLALLQRVAGMHQRLGMAWDIRSLHRDVMDLTALRWTLLQYLNLLGAGFNGLQRDRMPGMDRIQKRYSELGIADPLTPGVLRPLERSQEAHQDRFGNLDVALSGVVDVEHAALFGAEDALTWADIDRDDMVVVFRTDSLITSQIGRNIASLFFQDFMGYMGLRYLTPGARRRPLTLLVDEVGEIVYPDFRQAINKVGEAGGRLILAWQTEADLDAALGKDQADVIRANCQSRLTLRLADAETAETLSTLSPRARVTRVTSNRANLTGGRAGKGVTVEDDEMRLLEANFLLAQPVGQCFLRLDGSLYHINIPH